MTLAQGMAEPQFARVTGSLYWLQSSSRTIGFQATPGASIGDSPTLSQTWSGDVGGIYFFLPQAPTASDRDRNFAAGVSADAGMAVRTEVSLAGKSECATLVVGRADSQRKAMGIDLDHQPPRRFSLRQLHADRHVRQRCHPRDAGAKLGLRFRQQQHSGSDVLRSEHFVQRQQQHAAVTARRCCHRLLAIGITLSSSDDFQQLGVGIRYFYPYNAVPGERNVYIKVIDLPTILQPDNPSISTSRSTRCIRSIRIARTSRSCRSIRLCRSLIRCSLPRAVTV